MNEDLLGRLRDYEISVLMGGWSSEREISLKSGHAVTESLKTLGLKPRSIDLKSAEHIRDIVDSLDLAFIALHGKGGEDGFVQKILEDSGKKFTGSNSKSCEIAMNKLETKKIWRELSLPTPDFVEIINAGTKDSATIPYVSGEEDVGHLDKSFVVKPAREGSSLGITIVHPGRGSLEEAMKEDDFPVKKIHGKMRESERKQTYEDFKQGGARVLITSNLFARGIDVQQVSIVINFDIPKNEHTYLHRIGRSGRWGRKGIAINFQTKYDVSRLKKFEEFYSTQIEELPVNYTEHLNM